MPFILELSFQLIIGVVAIFIAWRAGRRLGELRMLKDQVDPPPPRNIRLHLHNGEVIPVDSVFSRGGTWQVLVPPDLTDDDISGVSVDELPARTTLYFPVRRAKG